MPVSDFEFDAVDFSIAQWRSGVVLHVKTHDTFYRCYDLDLGARDGYDVVEAVSADKPSSIADAAFTALQSSARRSMTSETQTRHHSFNAVIAYAEWHCCSSLDEAQQVEII